MNQSDITPSVRISLPKSQLATPLSTLPAPSERLTEESKRKELEAMKEGTELKKLDGARGTTRPVIINSILRHEFLSTDQAARKRLAV